MNIEPSSSVPLLRLRSSWADHIVDLRPTHALTIAFNKTLSFDAARGAIRKFMGRLDREILGARFHKAPSSRRTAYVAVPENLDSNTHLHIAMRVVSERHARVEYLLHGDRSWFLTHRLAPAGTHRLVTLHDVEGWASYMLKATSPNTEVITVH